jgi:hypothetical protein
MKLLLFYVYSLVGIVSKSDDGYYTLKDDGCVYEYVHLEEVYNWIESGEFRYDDFLFDGDH